MPAGAGKNQLAEELWLDYYNRVLFEKGVITEREHCRMALLIENRRPACSPGFRRE